MSLSKEEILKIANLAKLELSAKEIKAFPKQLNDILAYVDKLKSLDLKNIKPFISELSGQATLLRLDEVRASDNSALSQVVQRERDYLVVPQVLAKK